MSTGKRLKRSSDSICPTEEKWSVHQLTASDLKVVGSAPNTSQDAPLFVKRTCKQCGLTFGIRAAKLSNPKLGRFCSRSCGSKAWTSAKPKEWFQAHAARTLVPHVTAKGVWNDGVPMCEATREKLSASAKLRGDPFTPKTRGGNGKGMSECERILGRVLASGWVWNLVIGTKVLTRNGWSKLPSNYKPDFAWPERMTCLEVDGSNHNTKLGKMRDVKKQIALEALGWTVLRISNAEVRSRYGTSK